MEYKHKFSGSFEIKKSPNEKYFATIGSSVIIWDANSGKKISALNQLQNPSTMNFSCTGKLLAVKNTTGKIALYEMEGLKHITSVQPTKSEGCEVFFTPDERYIVSADWDGTIYTVEIESGEISIIKKDNIMYDQMEYIAEENQFVFHSNDLITKMQKHTRVVWEYPFDKNKARIIAYSTEYQSVIWSHVNQCFAVIDCKNRLLIMDKELKKIIQKVDVRNKKNKKIGVEKVAWSLDGKMIAVITDVIEYQEDAIYSVRAYEYKEFKLLAEYYIPYACYIEFTKDNKQFLMGGWEEGYCINVEDLQKEDSVSMNDNIDIKKHIEEVGLSIGILEKVSEDESLEVLFSISENMVLDKAQELDCDEVEALKNIPVLNKLTYLVYWFANETTEGGLSQYIFNSGCELCSLLKDALEFLDMPEHLKILEKAVRLHQQGYSIEDDKWIELDQEYCTIDENPMGILYEYIESSAS